MTKDGIYKKHHTYAEFELVPNKESSINAMEEYARQQAIAFFKFCLPGPSDFEPHISSRYSQFIEQQTKE